MVGGEVRMSLPPIPPCPLEEFAHPILSLASLTARVFPISCWRVGDDKCSQVVSQEGTTLRGKGNRQETTCKIKPQSSQQ